MSTGFNPQYQQYSQYPQAGPTASAVNIQIFSPTANAYPQGGMYGCAPYGMTQPMMQPMQQMQPMMQPMMPQQQMYDAAPPLYQTSSLYGGQPGANVSYPMNYNAPINQTNYNMAPNNQTEGTENKKEQKTKQKVILTDDYIKSLENYLNNEDSKIRLTAAKELLERFKEDNKRMADPALTALLNKVIQDPKASVRYIGLVTLDTGYAQGNQETAAILNQLKDRTDLEFGEDARLAAQILLKMSAQKVEVPDNTPDKPKKDSGKEEN